MNADRTAVLTVDGHPYRYRPLDRLLPRAELDTLPYAVRVLLENVARRAPGALADVVGRVRAGGGGCEVPVHPNRIMLHDTTCLPALATRRSNHEVMLRGAFTNPAVTNLLPGTGPGRGAHTYTADRTRACPCTRPLPPTARRATTSSSSPSRTSAFTAAT